MNDSESELDAQVIYGLSKVEARIYRMRSDGIKIADIADINNVSVQAVKNCIGNIKSKIAERNHEMNIITVNQAHEGQTRKALALMALRVIAIDQGLTEFYEGTHTVSLFNVQPVVGDVDFIYGEVLREIDIMAHNEIEAKEKAERIYKTYIAKGGKKGEMGYGWMMKMFNQYYVKYDIY